jgi:hypothetical protein
LLARSRSSISRRLVSASAEKTESLSKSLIEA